MQPLRDQSVELRSVRGLSLLVLCRSGLVMTRFLVASLLTSAAFAQDYYSAILDAAQAVPPATVPWHGFGTLRYDPATNNVWVFVAADPNAGPPSMYLGAVGVNG